jgi:hypothetical protein
VRWRATRRSCAGTTTANGRVTSSPSSSTTRASRWPLRDSWLEVELAYVAVDGARSGLRRLEDRAGKALSAENAEHVAGIADAVSAMQGHVDELLSQMSDDDRPSSGDSEANGDGVPDPDAQDEVIESNSLSPRRLWADFLTAAWGENGER